MSRPKSSLFRFHKYAIIALIACLSVSVSAQSWNRHTIDAANPSTGKIGADGVRLADVMIDLDGDGDLDVLTCEEVHDLGVFWYENPTR